MTGFRSWLESVGMNNTWPRGSRRVSSEDRVGKVDEGALLEIDRNMLERIGG
jgi:hypothetical protein